MERNDAVKIVESLLYMTDHPLNAQEILGVLETKSFDEADVRNMIQEIAAKLDEAQSPLQVVEVAGGIQMATRPGMASWIRKLYKERLTVRLSPSALETLAIIAYKQPIARSEIEQIRGVEATGVMDTLLERRLIKVVGRKETIGRPLLYGTSQEFLRQFGLKHMAELPDINSFLTTLPPAGDFVEAASESAPVQAPLEGVPVTARDDSVGNVKESLADEEALTHTGDELQTKE